MSQTERQKRLRLFLKKLNRQRKQQARKIDILCNDLISAQRNYIQRLSTISFAGEFYRSLLGSTDLNHLLVRTDRFFRQELPGVGVAFYLRQSEGCELYPHWDDEMLVGESSGVLLRLAPELADSLCKSDEPCTHADISRMSPESDLGTLDGLSLVTLPLRDMGRPLGFMLLWRTLPQRVTAQEVRRISPVMCGLSQAIRAARVPLPSGK
jgi:hypothetical protein